MVHSDLHFVVQRHHKMENLFYHFRYFVIPVLNNFLIESDIVGGSLGRILAALL